MTGNCDRQVQTWAGVVGVLPARILTLAASFALAAFVALVSLTVYAFFSHQVLKIAGWPFGQDPDIEVARTSEVLKSFVSKIDSVTETDGQGICLKFKFGAPYCFKSQQIAAKYIFTPNPEGCPKGWKNKVQIGLLMESSKFDPDFTKGGEIGGYNWAHPFLCESNIEQ